jgi:hypothetical protein
MVIIIHVKEGGNSKGEKPFMITRQHQEKKTFSLPIDQLVKYLFFVSNPIDRVKLW